MLFILNENNKIIAKGIIDNKPVQVESVEVFTLSGGKYVLLGQFTNGEVIESAVLAGLAITTTTLFNTQN